MSDLLDLLNAPNAPSPKKVDVGVALGQKAIGDPARLQLTPIEAKDKVAKGKLFLRNETRTYKLGKPTRPVFEHDHGHLSGRGEPKRALRTPTEQDKKIFGLMFTRLEVSELMCNERKDTSGTDWNNRQRYVDECGGNQPDANLALRNFLFGKGRSRYVDYERYLRDENRAAGLEPGHYKLVTALVEDFMPHAEAIGLNRQKFSITSKEMYAIGPKGFADGPFTTNWMRTLGGHEVWVSADVSVSVAPGGSHMVYEADLTFHAEDMYNFNPNSSDAKLNVKDWEGGQLELSGLGQEFMTYAVLYRHIKWDEKKPSSVKIDVGTSPPGTAIIKEDFAKEEKELWQAQLDAHVYAYPSEIKKMIDTFFERQHKKKSN